MVGVAGLEPATSRSQSAHSKPTELYPDYIKAIIQQFTIVLTSNLQKLPQKVPIRRLFLNY